MDQGLLKVPKTHPLAAVPAGMLKGPLHITSFPNKG